VNTKLHAPKKRSFAKKRGIRIKARKGKTSSAAESLLNTVARNVGRAAGTIVRATGLIASGGDAVVTTKKKTRKAPDESSLALKQGKRKSKKSARRRLRH